MLPHLPEYMPKCEQADAFIYPLRRGRDLILFVINRRHERQGISITWTRECEVTDLRLAMKWEADRIRCDLFGGEGRVFRLRGYFID